MNNNFEIALQLLGIGMLTVFAILFLVVFLGNIIIRFVNRFLPEAAAEGTGKAKPVISELDPKIVAVIVSAVKTLTGGKGQVEKIERV
ncbi:MAG TPA: OadG family protein [Prolixibacteraceae bacterium]|nr:OadG family protein [Prolixibacteraceae bacterium]